MALDDDDGNVDGEQVAKFDNDVRRVGKPMGAARP